MGTIAKSKLVVKNFSKPDETRALADKGKMEFVSFEPGVTVLRGRLQPGWRWSKHVQPIVKTKSCDAMHFGYVLSGRMGVKMDDGTEMEVGPGDVVRIPPGHDAWVVGDGPAVFVEFQGAANYAKPG